MSYDDDYDDDENIPTITYRPFGDNDTITIYNPPQSSHGEPLTFYQFCKNNVIGNRIIARSLINTLFVPRVLIRCVHFAWSGPVSIIAGGLSKKMISNGFPVHKGCYGMILPLCVDIIAKYDGNSAFFFQLYGLLSQKSAEEPIIRHACAIDSKDNTQGTIVVSSSQKYVVSLERTRRLVDPEFMQLAFQTRPNFMLGYQRDPKQEVGSELTDAWIVHFAASATVKTNDSKPIRSVFMCTEDDGNCLIFKAKDQNDGGNLLDMWTEFQRDLVQCDKAWKVDLKPIKAEPKQLTAAEIEKEKEKGKNESSSIMVTLVVSLKYAAFTMPL